MTSINRVDQAILLLKDRLHNVQAQAKGAAVRTDGATRADRADPLFALRQLVGRGGMTQADIRRALVRALLSDAFGDALSSSLEFQSLADRVTDILEDSDAGRDALTKALVNLA